MKKLLISMVIIGLLLGLIWRWLQAYHFYDLLFLRGFIGLISSFCIDIPFLVIIYLTINNEDKITSKRKFIKDIVIIFAIVILYITINDLIPQPECNGEGDCFNNPPVTMIDILKGKQ